MFQNKTHLYVKYAWYWEENNTYHYSDEYSLVFPSTSEVGATPRNNKKDKKLNTITSIDDNYEMYVIYPGIPNVIDPTTCTLNGSIDILLADYSAECQYKL